MKILGKIQGIDVSHHQGTIDWQKVKSSGKVDFVLMRAGYGESGKDSQFERNYLECKKMGIPVGVYWYTYAKDAATALREAKKFEAALQGKQIDLPVFLDIEENATFNSGKSKEIVETFCSYIESKGYYTGVYSSTATFNQYLSGVTARWCGWCADWRDKCYYTQPYVIWQKSSRGRVDGVIGYVDLDEFKDDGAFEKIQHVVHECGLNGYPKTGTPVEEKKEGAVKHKLVVLLDGVVIFTKEVE